MIRNSKAERGKCPINENRDQDILVSVSLKENRKALASDRKPVNNESSKSTATQIKRALIESPLTKTNPIKIGRYTPPTRLVVSQPLTRIMNLLLSKHITGFAIRRSEGDS